MQSNSSKVKEKRTKAKKNWHEMREHEKPIKQGKRKREKDIVFDLIA